MSSGGEPLAFTRRLASSLSLSLSTPFFESSKSLARYTSAEALDCAVFLGAAAAAEFSHCESRTVRISVFVIEGICELADVHLLY